ncbi:MAG: efflux RND transporter periplasmic adaptor subunit, partial [Planctomycetota bacterium]
MTLNSKELQAEMIPYRLIKVIVFSSLTTVIVTLAGCSQGESHGGASPAPTAIKVRVATPVLREVTDFMDYTGRTEPRESVEIKPRVSGYLTKVEFMGSLNSYVEEGTLLFEIDDRPYNNALDSAKARLASAEAALKTSAAELDRTQGLFDKGIVVKSELDRDFGRKAQADADILSARAGLKQAELDLEFTKIKAPISGLI